jgi:quinol monooxygenase YgiN
MPVSDPARCGNNIEHRTFNNQHPTSNTEATANGRKESLDVRSWLLRVGSSSNLRRVRDRRSELYQTPVMIGRIGPTTLSPLRSGGEGRGEEARHKKRRSDTRAAPLSGALPTRSSRGESVRSSCFTRRESHKPAPTFYGLSDRTGINHENTNCRCHVSSSSRQGSVLAPTRKEPGCVSYDVHQSADDPAKFLFYENWQSKEALEAHMRAPHIQILFPRVDELCVAFPQITQWDKIG